MNLKKEKTQKTKQKTPKQVLLIFNVHGGSRTSPYFLQGKLKIFITYFIFMFIICITKYFIPLFFIYLFIYFWLCWVFIVACGLSLVAVSRGYSSLRCAGFSLRWLLLLWSTGSRHTGFSSCGLRALEHRLSSCGTRASLLRSMWDLLGPGLEPVSPALAGRFLTTAPPGKSLFHYFLILLLYFTYIECRLVCFFFVKFIP